MRYRVSTVVDETTKKSLAGKKSGSSAGVAVVAPAQDAATTAYLRAFQAAVADKVRDLCEVQDARESREEDELVGEIFQFSHDLRAARSRLYATRARVARLSADTCRDALRVSEAADDRACAVLEASTAHARRESETGGPLPLRIDDAASNGGGGSDDDYLENGGGGGRGGGIFQGLETGVVEPKVSALIGKMAELPGPLKSVLQEIPELTASLAVSVQEAEAAIKAGQSRTEALLGKAPPTPLSSKKGKGAAGAAGAAGANVVEDERYPPEDARAAAREARVQQARKEWEAIGVGVVGGIFN
ncbi:expressed unknown protein [Ectocarpus siliculosus]|uniref:Uncharacterized protein n=1 Tax=Ectocarpus siliculosus TaxID=2880 RepID=D7FVV8_ECTSI|nr:expressed unknown protein [Ectocarpus siliculosus]|eukprot:CBJ25478.1 expressed unknown protein [Ectocarpus siliculosus]